MNVFILKQAAKRQELNYHFVESHTAVLGLIIIYKAPEKLS